MGSITLFDFENLDTVYFDIRVSNEDALLKGQLVEIHYPTGGWTEFEYEIHDHSAVMNNDRQSAYGEFGDIGGLRIKEIRNYDAINQDPVTSIRYHYKQNFELGGTLSSGVLAFKPKYVWVDWLLPSDWWPDGGYMESNWSTNVMVPLGNKFENHIGYTQVTEEHLDSSYTIYSFTSHLDIKDDLPYANLNLDFSPYARFSDKSHMRGKIKATRHFNSQNQLVKSEEMFYHNSLNDEGFDEYGLSIDAGFNYTCPPNNDDKYYRGNATKVFYNRFTVDSVRTRFYFGSDFVETTEIFNYVRPLIDSSKYTFLEERNLVNSDGKTHSTAYEYTFNHTSGIGGQQALLDSLVADHRLLEVLRESRVNDTLVDGTLKVFANFSGIPEVQKIQRYEATWHTGVLSGSWEDQEEILAYDLSFLRPVERKQTGWLPEEIALNGHGRITDWSYGAHSKSWDYYPDGLLQRFTDVDSLRQEYTYDVFSRLSSLTELPKNTAATYQYVFGDTPADRSYFKSRKTYPTVTNSEIDSIVNLVYVDGLGRTIQSVHKYAAPTITADVISRTEYDAKGRPFRVYEPVQADGNHGQFYTGNFNGGYHETKYLSDPLDRVKETTPPEWYTTACSYATNLAPLTSPEGTTYPARSLLIKRITDPDENITETVQDKLGRSIVQRQYKDTDTISTWTVYDNKNRPVRIYPPGASQATPGLIYEFRYDGDDNVIYRKIPDAEADDYRYDVRNLQTASRNAILRDANRWLVTHYDDHARPVKRGYHNSAGEPNDDQEPTIHTLLEEYFYDGFNGSTTTMLPIYRGRLKKQRIKMLDDISANNNWTETEYFYDNFGRVTTQAITNHFGGTETTMHAYDFADNMTLNIHNISGGNGINHVSRHTYDHQGRVKFDRINIDGQGERTLALNNYNHKNEVIERNLGRFATTGDHQYLQSIDYTYNAQGWLTGINDLFYGDMPVGPDPCSQLPFQFEEDSLELLSVTDDYDLFALGINYDQTIAGSGIPASKNGNITTLRWWQNGRRTQTYSYQYDFLNRVVQGVHGEYMTTNYHKRSHYDEDFNYDVRGNILHLNRRGVVHRPDLHIACYEPQTIDSLTYIYATGTNKLIQVLDHAPCPEVITLPPVIERDMTYAAGEEIRINTTDVLCDVDLTLIAGNRINIIDTLRVGHLCDSTPYVLTQEGPCPDSKFTEGFNQQSATGEYQYDDAGNMTYDPNKNLTFHYNHLNLPYRVVGQGGDTLHFFYASDGTLLRKAYTRSGDLQWKIDYIRGKEYRNDTLEAVYHTDGRVIKDSSSWSYEYWLKDHLGNVRVTFADNNDNGLITGNERRTRHDYYAFGYEHNGFWKQLETYSPKNRYGYNGKEMTEEMDLGMYNFGNRWQDPTIGRFTAVDRFADKYSLQSPYAMAANNPIKFIDINGDSIWIFHKERDYLYENGQLFHNGSQYEGKISGFLKRTVNSLNKIAYTSEGESLLQELQGSKNSFFIKHFSYNPKKRDEFIPDNIGAAYNNQLLTDPNASGTHRATPGGSGGTVYWNPAGTPLPTTSGIQSNASTDLGHELFHALDANRGLLDDRLHFGVVRSEWQAVYRENNLRSQINLPFRTHYLKAVDPSGKVLGGTGPRMITSTNAPILPPWYKP